MSFMHSLSAFTTQAVRVLAWVLVAYTIYVGMLFIIQRQVLFPRPTLLPPEGIAERIPTLERIWIETSFGKVETWLLPAAPGSANPAPAVIFAHGNAELIDFWAEDLLPLTQRGLAVLLVEYPGYGRSAGSPSQQSIVETFVTAYDMLVARPEIDPTRIVLFGRSLGGGAVAALATERPSAALILWSSFTSARSFAANYFAPEFLVLDPFDNLAVVTNYPGQVLVIHGSQDQIISYQHGVVLYEAAQHSSLLTLECDHNDCPPNWAAFWHEIEAFLRQAAIIELGG